MNRPIKVVIIVADFHQDIADYMIKIAKQSISKNKAKLIDIVRVPGSYEIPLIARTVIIHQKPDALVILGYIEKGHTMHGEIMGHAIHNALVNLQLKHNTPMGIGIIGPGATCKQAEERKKKSAQSAVKATLSAYKVMNGIIGE